MALKIKIKRIAGVPSTSDLESGEIGLNTSNNQLYVNIGGTITSVSSSGGGGSVDISAVAQDIIPDADDTRDLGSTSKAITNEEGAPARSVPLFTAAGGLTTPAKKFTFKASNARNLVFSAFTKADGNALSVTNATQLFEF